MKLSKKQAQAFTFLLMAHQTADENLKAGSMDGYKIWCSMRDEKCVKLFGMKYDDLHKFAYTK